MGIISKAPCTVYSNSDKHKDTFGVFIKQVTAESNWLCEGYQDQASSIQVTITAIQQLELAQ